jgi:hypothetical protein
MNIMLGLGVIFFLNLSISTTGSTSQLYSTRSKAGGGFVGLKSIVFLVHCNDKERFGDGVIFFFLSGL